MKSKRKRNERKLLAAAVQIFGAILLVCAVFLALAYPRANTKMTVSTYIIVLCIAIAVLAVIIFLFVRNIYLPIRKLETALHTLDSKNKDIDLKLDVSVNSLADTITSILDELIHSMEREHSEIVLRQQSAYAELQSQINPHFLYNTLESIRGQAVIDDNYVIANMTEALAKYFRYNIGKDNDEVTLKQELENVKNYIYIQQYRFKDKFDFHLYNHNVDEEYLSCIIPKMTLQPIVENAIYHGMENKVEKGNINIHIELTKERLIILVEDDGGGMDEITLKKLTQKLLHSEGILSMENQEMGHNGIAMENVNNRLKLLYGKDYGIRVSSTIDFGTEVELTIPLRFHKREQG